MAQKEEAENAIDTTDIIPANGSLDEEVNEEVETAESRGFGFGRGVYGGIGYGRYYRYNPYRYGHGYRRRHHYYYY